MFELDKKQTINTILDNTYIFKTNLKGIDTFLKEFANSQNIGIIFVYPYGNTDKYGNTDLLMSNIDFKNGLVMDINEFKKCLKNWLNQNITDNNSLTLIKDIAHKNKLYNDKMPTNLKLAIYRELKKEYSFNEFNFSTWFANYWHNANSLANNILFDHNGKYFAFGFDFDIMDNLNYGLPIDTLKTVLEAIAIDNGILTVNELDYLPVEFLCDLLGYHYGKRYFEGGVKYE